MDDHDRRERKYSIIAFIVFLMILGHDYMTEGNPVETYSSGRR